MPAPTVSIVTATYNRSGVLRHTIESVLASRFADFELLVIGDACTDDTEDVVRSFGDARVQFVNLAVNAGEQSAPNNEGVRRARGRYVAFLNHDDLWTPEHLDVCLAAIEEHAADLVFTMELVSYFSSDTWHLTGGAGAYEPWMHAPASSWLFRRELFDAVGPWRSARELFLAPSHEWIFRAWKQRRKLIGIPRATVVAVSSGLRKNSYAQRDAPDNARIARELRDDPHFVERALAIAAARELARKQRRPVTGAALSLAKRALLAAGIHPYSIVHALRHGGRGGFIDRLRRTRGLSPLPRRGDSNA